MKEHKEIKITINNIENNQIIVSNSQRKNSKRKFSFINTVEELIITRRRNKNSTTNTLINLKYQNKKFEKKSTLDYNKVDDLEKSKDNIIINKHNKAEWIPEKNEIEDIVKNRKETVQLSLESYEIKELLKVKTKVNISNIKNHKLKDYLNNHYTLTPDKRKRENSKKNVIINFDKIKQSPRFLNISKSNKKEHFPVISKKIETIKKNNKLINSMKTRIRKNSSKFKLKNFRENKNDFLNKIKKNKFKELILKLNK